ncbi:cell division protein FtsQ/DivIB [Fictibacillus iocasae]|uniref:Cell division protein DivIB n=1 Tax=Fictibacillus iocasae TaxID=2715437 RepID=A0ABW2NNR1_9BACL
MDKLKVVTIEDRIPKLKEQRRQKANRRLIFYLSLFFLLVLAVVYFQSGMSNIKKLNVKGNYFVDDKQIIAASGISLDSKFMNVDEEEIQRKLTSLNEVSSANVKRSFYNEVTITVQEFQRVGYIKQKDRYYPMLQNGAMLSPLKKEERPVNAPVIMQWEDKDRLEELAQELRTVPEGIIHRISEIHQNKEDMKSGNVTLYMTDGNEVKISINGFSERLSNYPLMVEQLKSGEKGTFYIGISSRFEKYVKKKKGDSSETER